MCRRKKRRPCWATSLRMEIATTEVIGTSRIPRGGNGGALAAFSRASPRGLSAPSSKLMQAKKRFATFLTNRSGATSSGAPIRVLA
jgi:hypothetical protein